MALNPITELEQIVDAFRAAGISYALCGGLALGLHGQPRATQDIDFLVEAQTLPSAIACAKSLGFDVPARMMVFGLRAGKRREVHGVSKLDPATGGLFPLDFPGGNDQLQGLRETTVTVQRGACGGCFNSLPPHFVNEVRKSDKINVCESCGRIIISLDPPTAGE